MGKAEVRVTGSERAAAQALVRRSAVTGRYVSPAVKKIATAQASRAAKSTQNGAIAKKPGSSKGLRSAVPRRDAAKSSASGKFKSTVSRIARRAGIPDW